MLNLICPSSLVQFLLPTFRAIAGLYNRLSLLRALDSIISCCCWPFRSPLHFLLLFLAGTLSLFPCLIFAIGWVINIAFTAVYVIGVELKVGPLYFFDGLIS